MKKKDPNTSAIAISYDEDFDVLYWRPRTGGNLYGDEDDGGIVTLRRIEDDTVAGMIVYDFKQRSLRGKSFFDQLPLPIDITTPEIAGILH